MDTVREQAGQAKAMPAQTPSVGRVVHYVAFGTPGGEYTAGAHRAAIITSVAFSGGNGVESTVRVDLCILNPTGLHFREDVPADEHGMSAGTWHWPERV